MSSVDTVITIFAAILFAIMALQLLSQILGSAKISSNKNLLYINLTFSILILILSIISVSQNPKNGENIAILVLSIFLIFLIYGKYIKRNDPIIQLELTKFIFSLIILVLSTI
jgi:hypothetical protein